MGNQSTIVDNILAHKAAFAVVFTVVFAISFAILYAVDVYPEAPKVTPDSETNAVDEESNESETESAPRLHLEANTGEPVRLNESDSNNQSTVVVPDTAALPTLITFPSLANRSVTVLNPSSRAITDLDATLLNGAVRHPDSATFTNEGTIFILGHSSYLPNVMNKNFQAFNGIQNLAWGDTIELYSDDTKYTYRVELVYKAKASEVTVPIAGTGPKLVIATCNSFASKDDRYIVEAKLIDSTLL